MKMTHSLLLSKNGNFELIDYSGIGSNNTPYRRLKVISKDVADKHVIEIKLSSNYPEFNGEPVQYKYNIKGTEISHGMRCVRDTFEDTEEYIEVLQEALNFAKGVNKYIEKHPEWQW